MKTTVFSIFVFFLNISLFSQVGINTTTPSPSAALDISSSNNGTNFGGLMPPKVTMAQRDLIPVTAADDGLLVYVTDGAIRYLQIYDGVDGVWRTIYPTTFELSTVLAGWNVTGLTGYGTSPYAATTTNSSVVVGGLSRGAGITTTGTAAGNAWGGNGFDLTIPEQASAIDAENFATFTITPSFGVNVSITGIDTYNIRRSAAGPTTGIWQYSIDGVNFIDIGTPIVWGGTTTAVGNPQSPIDLSGIPALQNLTSATTVIFRIVSWEALDVGGNPSSTGTWYINQVGVGINDLVVRGNVTN